MKSTILPASAITRLAEQGVSVRIHHVRRGLIDGRWVEGVKAALKRDGASAISHWGATTVELTNCDGQVFSAHCSTLHPDTFDRRRGVRIALGRAMKAAGIRI